MARLVERPDECFITSMSYEIYNLSPRPTIYYQGGTQRFHSKSTPNRLRGSATIDAERGIDSAKIAEWLNAMYDDMNNITWIPWSVDRELVNGTYQYMLVEEFPTYDFPVGTTPLISRMTERKVKATSPATGEVTLDGALPGVEVGHWISIFLEDYGSPAGATHHYGSTAQIATIRGTTDEPIISFTPARPLRVAEAYTTRTAPNKCCLLYTSPSPRD